MGDLTPSREVPSERIPGDGRPLIQIGQWYWVKTDGSKKFDWFACVTEIGSNFIRVESPNGNYERIHENEFEKVTKLEVDPEGVIRGNIKFYQDGVQQKLGQIREITARLGVQTRESSAAPKSESRELSTFNAMPDLKKYKKDLIRAKDKTLPKLFEKMEKDHENVALWMQARTVPMKAMCDGLKGAVDQINDRIFNVSLYAGLTEEVEKIADGEPAGIAEKLRLFQRMCYMDEECLVNYRHGGMEFKDIEDFDGWILERENRDRILPWPRCMVAFRVRREEKDREYDGTLSCAMMNFHLKQADETTFMYIRNGDQLYRMTCQLEFDEHIFPSQHQVNFAEPLMAETRCDEVKEIITKRHWEDLCREWDELKRKYDEWEKNHTIKDHEKGIFNPHHMSTFDDPYGRYEPFDKSSVYYDDMQEKVEKQLKYYNRIALIVQGLFDRSEVLHPHVPARLWMPGGMEAVVELVYDGAGAIHYKEPPDFAEYRKKVNESMGKGSFTIGQESAWEIREAKIKNERWNRRQKPVERYQPYGDPGPGYVAEVLEWQKRSGQAIFRWERKRRSFGKHRWGGPDGPVPCVIRVKREHLFNVSGYKPGDYRQFYLDPRTRAKYLRWAPLLLAAEEWHAGNIGEDGHFKKKGKA